MFRYNGDSIRLLNSLNLLHIHTFFSALKWKVLMLYYLATATKLLRLSNTRFCFVPSNDQRVTSANFPRCAALLGMSLKCNLSSNISTGSNLNPTKTPDSRTIFHTIHFFMSFMLLMELCCRPWVVARSALTVAGWWRVVSNSVHGQRPYWANVIDRHRSELSARTNAPRSERSLWHSNCWVVFIVKKEVRCAAIYQPAE